MPYSSFTLKEAQKSFGLNVTTSRFCQSASPVAPSAWLSELLQESVELATTLGTEKARSEFIIAPILFELRKSLAPHLGLFSGTDFTVAPEEGLNGICDFLLTRSSVLQTELSTAASQEILIKAPVIVVIEAKKGDLNAGLGQCAAEMVAAQRFNAEAKEEIEHIYGTVTTGTQWQFLNLTGQELNIDVTEYVLTPIDRILGILHWMVNHP
jgi:hypothetical protein